MMTTRGFRSRRALCPIYAIGVLSALLFMIPVAAGQSVFCHVTDGTFTVCPDGNLEWSDVTPEFFPESGSYLYADQADLDPVLGTPESPADTFMLLYDEVGRTAPLGPDEYFLVSFTTVEVEDGVEELEHYVIHIFTDGTIIFIEDGVTQQDENGNIRVEEIEGQRGIVGFGPSPNSAVPHVIAEFQIGLTAAGSNFDGAYSPDPQFWSSDPPKPNIIIVSETTNGRTVRTVVSNTGNATATGLRITQQAFTNEDLKLELKEVTGFSLAAGRSRTFVFTYDQVLKCGYSDVFDQSGKLLAATLCELIINPQSPIVFDFPIPYPIFVEEVLGITADFFLEAPIVDNVPGDWTVLSQTPAPGEVFILSPGDTISGQMIVNAPDDAPEGTIAAFVIPYVQLDTGFRAEIPLAGVVDSTPPVIEAQASDVTQALSLTVTAEARDEASSLGDVFVEYSTNGGAAFTRGRMDLKPPHEFNPLGLTRSGYEADIGPFPLGTEVLWRIVAEDKLLNVAESTLATASITFPAGITNAGFESCTLNGWDIAGGSAVNAITSLGPPGAFTPILPPEGQCMAFLSTAGFASAPPGTQGSVISQTFIMPTDAITLEFVYQYVSNDSSGFENFFLAELITDVGTFTLGSADNAAGSPAGGFLVPPPPFISPGVTLTPDPAPVFLSGVNILGSVLFFIPSSLMTDRVNSSFEIPPEILGTVVTLRFTAGDVIDTAVDSAVVIDAITLNGITTPTTDLDKDKDGVIVELDNCPGVFNPDQQDNDFNGIGDACQTAGLEHGTAAFLQAGSGGSTIVEPTPLPVEEEPGLLEKIVRIVDFRIAAGLTDSPEDLTINLVESLVEVGLVTVEESDLLIDDVLAEIDTDGDGIPDGEDACPESDLSPTVVIDGCNSGVANLLFDDGCTILDLIRFCAGDANNHGQFVSCVAQLTNNLKKQSIISGQEKDAIQNCAAKAGIP